MSKQIFVNLAVSDLAKSTEFYTSLGFTINPQFSDEQGKCMVWSEHIFVMILTHEKFRSFAHKPLADTKNGLAGLFALTVESREAVEETVQKGIAAGGTAPFEMKDYGFMQQRNIEDPDGHTWEIFFMDMAKFPSA